MNVSFKDIKGQDSAINFLKGILKTGRISHAYIFLGPRGIGRKLTALNFAKALNCLLEDGEAPCGPSVNSGFDPEQRRRIEGCGQCVSCKRIGAANHPDVLLIEKDGASIKTLRQAQSLYPGRSREIKIGSIREVIRLAGLKPYEARKKVFIIDDSASMNAESSNALLKTLEEPPADSIFILIAESLDSLLATIVSRCTVVKFFPLDRNEVKEILTKVYDVDEKKAHILSCISSGSLGEALRLKDESFFEKRSRAIKALQDKTFFDSDFEELSREDLQAYLDIMLTWYRDILVAKSGHRKESILVNIDKFDDIINEAKETKFEFLYEVIKEIISTGYFLEQNANPKLAMSVLGLKLVGN